jgi:hypothetical protein
MARPLLTEDHQFDVQEKDLGVAPPIDDEAVYTLRPITVEYARRVYKTHTHQELNRRTHQKDDHVDTVAAVNDLLDYCLVAWAGVVDRGQPVACVLANKLRLPSNIQTALIELAQQGQVTPEATSASFRQPATPL